MAMLHIYEDSRGLGTCRSCGRSIEWAELTSGARHPFDPPIRPVRTQPDLMGDGSRVVQDVDTASSPSHFASCPHADAWRKRRAAK